MSLINDSDVKLKLLRVAEILSQPQFDNGSGKFTTIESVLIHNARLSLEIFETEDEIDLTDVRWAYSFLCQEALLQLSSTLGRIHKLEAERRILDVSERLSDAVLSVKQEKCVEKCLQFVFVFGILPYLVPNVGIPVGKRTEFSFLLQKSSEIHISHEEKYTRLVKTVHAALQLIREGYLASFIYRKHLADILAALLQICHAPLKKPSNPDEESLIQRMQNERPSFFADLSFLVEVSHPALLIQSLLLLQGPSPSHSKIIRDAPQAAPSWLRRTCARLLTDQLIKPRGVINIVDAVIDKDSNAINADLWQRCDNLARVISTPPSGEIQNQMRYFSVVAPQILELLNVSSKEPYARHYRYIGTACLRIISSRSRQFAEELFLSPILKPFEDEKVSDEVENSIDKLHSIFVSGSDPTSEFLLLLHPHLQTLLHLYQKVFTGILHAKNQLEELLRRMLKFSDHQIALQSIQKFLSSQTFTSEDLVELLELDDRKIEAVVHLLNVCNDRELLCEFFLISLSNLQKYHESEEISEVRQGLMNLKLLTALVSLDTLQESLLENSSKTVDFIKIYFERFIKDLNSPEKDTKLENETLSLIFALIAMLIEQNLKQSEDPDSVWNLMDPLKNPLETLARNHSSNRIRNGADDLRVAVATRGFVYRQKDTQSQETSYQEALRLLEDPLVPVQGHALLSLSKLLEGKDAEAMENKGKLLEIFLEALEHEDSYIYLMAIQGLTNLANYQTEIVLDVLTKELHSIESKGTRPLVEEVNENHPQGKSESSGKVTLANRSPEIRMKVGEALLKIIRLLGPMVHRYKGQLLNLLLNGTKDEDLFIRASSLSNLGDLCSLLGYSLGSILHELFSCVTSLAFYDPAIEVRRAAVLLMTLLLRGLGADALKILEPILKDLYRTLKDIINTESDEIMRIHGQEALSELSEIVKKFLTPQISMTKTIYVTRPPP